MHLVTNQILFLVLKEVLLQKRPSSDNAGGTDGTNNRSSNEMQLKPVRSQRNSVGSITDRKDDTTADECSSLVKSSSTVRGKYP